MTEQKNNTNVLLGILMVLVVVSMIVTGFGLSAVANREVKLDTSSLETNFNEFGVAVVAKLDAMDSKLNVDTVTVSEDGVSEIVDSGSYSLTKEEYEEEQTEAKALELANEYVNSKDFKELFENITLNVTNNITFNGVDVEIGDTFELGIEDYKDITEIKVIESDYKGRKHSDNVTYELKVYFNVDGDDDDTAYVKLEGLIVEINDLEYDDDFEDAECKELSELNIEKSIVKVKYFD